MEERKNTEEYLRIVPRIGYYLKSRNIADIFKYKSVLFAAGGIDRRIYLFSNSLEHMSTLRGHKKSIMCLCALPNKILASGSGDTNIKIWDTKERRLISTLSGHTRKVSALCYVREGVIVSGSWDKSLIIWIKQSGCYIYSETLRGHKSHITGIIRMSKTEIVSGERNRRLRIWDLDQGICTRYIYIGGSRFCCFLYQMKQGIGREVVVSFLGEVKVWGAANNWGTPLKEFSVCNGRSIELFSQDLLLRGGFRGDLEFIDYRVGCEFMTIYQLHSNCIRCM